MPYLLFVLICAVWGSNFILMNRASTAFGPIAVGFWRLFLGGLALCVCWWLWQRSARRSVAWKHILLLAIIGHAYPFTVLPLLVTRGFGHSFFALVISFVPLATILASIPLLKKWPTQREVIGVLVGLIALVILMWDGQLRGMSPGILLLALSVPTMYAISNTYIRWKLTDEPTIAVSAEFYLLGSMLLVPAWLLLPAAGGTQPPPGTTHTTWAIAALVWLGVMGTGFSGAVFVHLIQQYGPLFAGMAAYVVPLVALGWGIYDGETITTRQLAALATVVVMVIFVQWGSASANAAPKTLSVASDS